MKLFWKLRLRRTEDELKTVQQNADLSLSQQQRLQELQELRLSILETLRLFRSFYTRGIDPLVAMRWVSLEEKANAWVDKLSGGRCKSDDFEAVKSRMASFMAAGFVALCGRGKGANK